MGKQKLLDKKQEVRGSEAIITETVETTMDATDLNKTIKNFEEKMLRNQKEFYSNKKQRDYYKALYIELNPMQENELKEDLEV